MNVYVDGVLQGGGGGGSLPGTPVAVLLDAASPNTFVGLDGTGAGESLQPAAAMTLLGAVPSSRTIAGLDLSVNRSALAMRYALRPLTTDTIPSATPWVTRNGEGSYAGTATVNVGSGSIDFSCLSASSQTVAAAARAPWLLRPATILACRISAFSGSVAGDQIFLGLTNVINVQNPISLVNICGNDACYMMREGGSTATPQTVSGITDGQGWAILVARGGDVDGFVAIGSGGAFPQDDSTWTYLGTIARGDSTRDPWPLVCVQMVRDSGSGNVTATVQDFSYAVWI